MSEVCGDCRYCRVDEDTKIPYCKQVYVDVSLDSVACDSFEGND